MGATAPPARGAHLAPRRSDIRVDELDEESDDEEDDARTLHDSGGAVSTQTSARVLAQKESQARD